MHANEEIDGDLYQKLKRDVETQLYPRCTRFSKLIFSIYLFHIKNISGWSSKSCGMILETFPIGVELPNSVYEAKKIISDLGFDYEMIDMYPNNCTSYTKDNALKDRCVSMVPFNGKMLTINQVKIAIKAVLFSPGTNIKKKFTMPKAIQILTQNNNQRVNDRVLRHLVDDAA